MVTGFFGFPGAGLKLETPPPTPPLEGRGAAAPSFPSDFACLTLLPRPLSRRGETPPDLPEGEELAGALYDGDDGAATPLPSRGGVGGGVSNFILP